MYLAKKTGWSLFFAILLCMVFFSNFSVMPVGLMDEKRIAEALLLLVSSLLSGLLLLHSHFPNLSRKTVIGASLFIILLSISSILAPLPQWAFLQVGWLVLLGELVLLSAWLYRNNKQRFLKLFIGSLFLMAAFYLGHILATTFSSFFIQGWPTWPHTAKFSMKLNGKEMIPQGFLGFANMRFFNHLQTWSLPLLVFGIIYYKKQLIAELRYLMFAVASGWWMLAFASDARGTMVASGISLLVVGFWYRKKAKKFILTYISAALVGLAGYWLLFLLPNQGGREILTRYSSSVRMAVWKYTLPKIAQNPLWGLGPMHFSYAGIHPPASTPHDIILQSMVEWGIPAFLIAALLAITAWLKFARQKHSNYVQKEILIKLVLAAALTAGIAHSMVSGILNTPLSQLMACIILGWAIGHYYEHAGKPIFKRRKNRGWRFCVIGSLLVANTLFISLKVGADVTKLNERKRLFLKQQINDSNRVEFYPRFWQQGKIGVEDSPPSKAARPITPASSKTTPSAEGER